MFSPRTLLNFAIGFHSYIWVDIYILKETPKAILIMFDNRKIWLPKAWIAKIELNETKRPRTQCPRKCQARRARPISIKISEYHWAKKF